VAPQRVLHALQSNVEPAQRNRQLALESANMRLDGNPRHRRIAHELSRRCPVTATCLPYSRPQLI